MLLDLWVANFRSIKEEVRFSLLAQPDEVGGYGALLSVPNSDHRAVPVAALFGPNGAGKSNLIRALWTVRELVLGAEPGHGRWLQPHAWGEPQEQSLTSEFLVRLADVDRVYDYGLHVSREAVKREWLAEVVANKERVIFERELGADGKSLQSRDGDLSGVSQPAARFLREGFGNATQTLLASLAKSVPSLEGEKHDPIACVSRWFRERLLVLPHGGEFVGLAERLGRADDLKTFVEKRLWRWGTGVASLGVEVLANRIRTPRMVSVETGLEIRTGHWVNRKDAAALKLEDESDGTQRLVHLLLALHGRRDGRHVVVVDELDASLHTLLAEAFIREAVDLAEGRGGQLIFTSHDTALLNSDLLRRDGIWFVRKPRSTQATELYPLSDYEARSGVQIDEAYLEGRYEAVPPVRKRDPAWLRGTADAGPDPDSGTGDRSVAEDSPR